MNIGTGISEMVLEKISNVPEWMHRGTCVVEELDPFTEPSAGQMVAQVCPNCPVKTECGEFTNNMNTTIREISFGVFDGYNYSGGGS